MPDIRPASWQRYLPILQWSHGYNRGIFSRDLIAAIIVTVMLIPQSLAYAMLAGVPPEMGLYASILPLIAYAIFGTSRTLSVGPVAVVSLMTATAISKFSDAGTIDYINAAIILALLSGLMLILMGLLRFGFLANFLSHPVVAGFITASGIIIALGQLKHILGIQAQGDNVLELGHTLFAQLGQVNPLTCGVGISALLFLFWARTYLKPTLMKLGIGDNLADKLVKAGPVFVVIATTVAAYLFDFAAQGVAIVGTVPQGLPSLQLPDFSFELWSSLATSALLISTIGYVESVSVGKTLAAKRRQRIDPNQELIGLGSANVASAVSAGFPVTGGFSRSVVNFDAGAETPAASILTALGITAVALFLTPYLYYLPQATLAAAIIVAVLSLVDFSSIRHAWHCSRSDFYGLAITIAITLFFGVERGVLSGVVVSIAIHLYRTSRPHMAVVGEVPGTEHFRNVKRHDVVTHPNIISLRVDESLYFANAAYLEDSIYGLIADNQDVEHIILMCPAVNEIDMSALEVLESVNERLGEQNLSFNLSEVKGPVMDFLQKTDFLEQLNGQVFLTQHQAIEELKTPLAN
ncbi:sulfate permease [Aestuariirhabdus sp. Z084]|uniref:SulP family inorganic anion transporter n=1 Tax=Aestuariirhabdus haliotis TaxID=2918751 RepID=UPI00201B434A|nr:sulfate permease [Aestuariirhabdus haliotis]MCL6417207.1 sulfate permease [Aestuariirhabdus haliotis]MCL6421179.1 sulfate permease [Aestuariirhabdus haliotis]